jgi:hypothetical protein
MTPPDIALSLRIGAAAFTGDTGAIPAGLCDGAEVVCAECTELQAPGARLQAPERRHLNWAELGRSLPSVPRILLAHLGEDARRGIPGDAGVVVCDDLQSFDI